MFTKARLRISYPAWLWIAAFIVFSVFLTLAPAQAGADTIDDVVDQMQAVYDKLELDPTGKDAVDTAKDNISDLRSRGVDEDPWDDVFAILLTYEVKTRLGGEAAAKEKLKDFLCDLTDIQYSTDKSILKSSLQSFKTEHASTVRDLFGNDFTIDDLYGYLMEAKEEVPGEISEDVDTLIAIARGDYGGIRDRAKVWMKEALKEAATGSYSTFLTKLSNIGWSVDKLIDAKDKIGDAVDPGYAGEIALMKAYVRSETYFIRDGNRLDGDITLKVGNTLPLELSVLGYDWAGDVLDWDTSDHSKATVDNTNKILTAVAAGDTTLTAYKPGSPNQWAYKGTVHVQSSGGGGGGGGGGTTTPPDAPPPAADITVPTDGGTFTTADGQAGLIVPEGTLLQEATIKIVLVTDPIPDPSMDFASNVYEFTSSVAFNGSVTIVLKYDPAKVADPTKLGIYYYNETLGQWVYLGGIVDPVTGTVSVTVDHFTKFAILINPNKVKLSDIDKHWGYRYIDRLVGMGIISGYEDGTFRPDRTISRAEFAAIIAKARGLTLDSQAALTFSDAAAVPGWARPAVAAAVQAGIINGYEDNTFRPERQITRAELATMIVRAMKISPAASPALTFSDAGDIPAWARGYVATAVEKGIIAGRPDNTFGAPDSATRAEAATMVIKMLEALGI